ncbi:MAG TPA: phosphatidate cytidylyltransferase [Burkholderiaceae bacterium]|nr:phosphatidate cytidylyltransferase [Burkholderiaceae bacterium]
MLGQRIVTAVILLALLVPALLASSPWPFQILTLGLIGAAAWEWGRLNQAGAASSLALGMGLVVACALAWRAGWTASTPPAVWWVVTLLWVAGGALSLRTGPQGWPQIPRVWRWTLGLVALWAAWLALTAARARGLNFILSVFCLVWVADTAAYFGGRALGRRKLAVTISPGKSWEGVWTGMAAVLALALAWLTWQGGALSAGPSLFSELDRAWGLPFGALLLVGLAAMSVVGDLFESLVKRAAGQKDSSRLLPGHGGVLDRIDALLPVFPAAMALSTWGRT